MEFKIINQNTVADPIYTRSYCTQFYFTHLEEYGDKIADILKCIDYVMHPDKGNIVIGIVDSEIVGIVILNNTGMKDPENILVYIAVDNSHRGRLW
jgi:hypothetical protein